MNADLILFLILGAVGIISAILMIASKNTIYSALYLVLNFVTIALFYLLLGGPFIAMAQITVYAGAIMVLFLFVIMILGVDQISAPEALPYQRPVAIVLGLALVAEAAYMFFIRPSRGLEVTGQELTGGFGTPSTLADVLYNQYALPIEVIGVLLLVAVVGVIAMTKSGKSRKA